MTDKMKQDTHSKAEKPSGDSPDPLTIDREELRRLYEESCAGLEEGAIVKGKIIKVSKDEVYVDVGYKSEGIVPLSEFGEPDSVKPGDEIDVLLESKEDADGMVVLSRIKAEKQQRWDDTILHSREGDVVTGKIVRKVRGGVIVDIGMDAFLPASQIDIRHVSNIDDYMYRVLEFKIIKINSERKNIVLSRRELLEEERARNRDRLLAEIEVGETREGIVKNITDFGAFIDLYGMDGLLHITDMTWGRINHPSEMLSIGDKVEVTILDFDRERQRIALGLKQRTANPWEDIDSKYPVGSIVKGKIVNIVPYGAFIEIEKGVEGLIHISEMSWTKRINHPSEVLSVGDEVEAMVLNIKKNEAKISLGIKQTEFNPWSVVEEKYPAGTHIRGRVRNITSYGAFVELEEGIDGLVHISDMSWTRKINHPSEVLKKGEITEAVVLAVDQEAKKITLGLKQLEENPWETIDEVIQVGSLVEAEVTKIADFGVFATIENGIECLIHISQLSEKPFQKIEDIVKKNDKVHARVDRIDKQRRKIALSIKDYQRDLRLAEEKVALEAVKAMSLGDQSIIGMREHLEQALERATPVPEEQPVVEAPQPAEAMEEGQEPPLVMEKAAEGQLSIPQLEEAEAPGISPEEEAPLTEKPPEQMGAPEVIAPEPASAEVAAEAAPPTEAVEPSAEPEAPTPEGPAAEAAPPELPSAEVAAEAAPPTEAIEPSPEPEPPALEEPVSEAPPPESTSAEPSPETAPPTETVEPFPEPEAPAPEEPVSEAPPESPSAEPSPEAAPPTETVEPSAEAEKLDTGEAPQEEPWQEESSAEEEPPESAAETEENLWGEDEPTP